MKIRGLLTPLTRVAARSVAVALLSLGPFVQVASAQGVRPDTAGRDTARRLDQVRVTVTRSPMTAQRAPWAVAVQDKAEISRGQATLGIDEALNNVPGVIVMNRYNYSVDQRLSIRGAGARANFGIRGVKVLLDGVPQSLPDGQNQLTNLDLNAVSRVEVLRGSASSLYGNGSGGVIAFETDRSAPDRLSVTARALGGTYGTAKHSARIAGRTEKATAALSISRTKVAGFRMFDTAETRQANAAIDYSLGDRNTLELRLSYGDLPTSLNPGALTQAEYNKRRDSASAFNMARYANKVLSQSQFSARVKSSRDWLDLSVVGYVQRRFVDNPLATAPPGTTGAAIGTLSTLNRWVTGGRVDAAVRSTTNSRLPELQTGVDLQRSFDIRRNWRVTGGRRTNATDTLFLDQGESVIALGPFAALRWTPREELLVSAGGRADNMWFDVMDNFLSDNVDNSDSRTMSAFTWHVGSSWVFSPEVTAYANIASAFETPTTTELSSRPDGTGGFNPNLGPQRVNTIEGGIRGDVRNRLTYSVAAFQSTYEDAIVQFLETNGRAYFRNAGETRNRGLEIGAKLAVTDWLDASLAWTESRFRFTDYVASVSATVKDTLNENRVAGVPDRFYRVGLRWRRDNWTADADHTWSGDMYADDRNLIKVPGWQDGVLNIRLAWDGNIGGARVTPFAGVNNALDIKYVGAVTVNGANGRVLEPAPLRHFFLGLEAGWRVVP